MKRKGFITLYLLPIFLLIIALSVDVLKGVTSTYKLTNNYFGKERAKAICDIGIKHGVKTSKSELTSKNYYVNLIDNNLVVSDRSNGSNYVNINISVSKGEKIININIESEGKYELFSQSENYSYSVDIE